MKSVLIIGGYGGFGARLSVRLAKAGWQVLVGGGRLEAAQAFCANLPLIGNIVRYQGRLRPVA